MGPPNPHLSPVEGWDDSSKYGFSEPCSSCRGQEGKGILVNSFQCYLWAGKSLDLSLVINR